MYTIWLSGEAIDLGRPYWILHPVSCHTADAVTTVFKCSWGWTQKASETCRVILQLLINILSSCITLVLYIYIYILWYNIYKEKSFNTRINTSHKTDAEVEYTNIRTNLHSSNCAHNIQNRVDKSRKTYVIQLGTQSSIRHNKERKKQSP